MADDGYALRPLDLDARGIPVVAALLREVFPDAVHFIDEVVRWQYLENPDGPAVGFNAWANDALAAHYVTIPLRALVDGREERGLLSLNTATHPRHQGRKLFTRLAQATYDEAARQGYGFVVGVANANSTHGFTRKLGFQAVSPLLALVGAGPLRFVPEAEAPCFTPLHGTEKMAWRLAHPAHRYTVARQGRRAFILSERTMKGARFILGVDDPEQVPPALMHARMPRVKAFIGLDPAIDRKRSIYLNVPMRFRPAPLNFIWKDLSGQARSLDAERVRFHAFDFDTL
ncbi:MAG: GNAT family N-acetyltransferase [Flavobacteriales bacterium]|nr:GNAT family N-acetyltransferase [Flavobacteriales bacterium]